MLKILFIFQWLSDFQDGRCSINCGETTLLHVLCCILYCICIKYIILYLYYYYLFRKTHLSPSNKKQLILSLSPPSFSLNVLHSSTISEVQRKRSATSQPTRRSGHKTWSRPSSEWRPGPHVVGGQDKTLDNIHQQTLPVLPQHQELQLLHLSDCVCIFLCRTTTFSVTTAFVKLLLTILFFSYRVKELSNYYSEMDPVRQKWTYTFFIYPFLSGDRVAGKHFLLMNLMILFYTVHTST